MTPLVTVVILSYARPEALRRAIESVGEQSYPSLDILVIDNKSPRSDAIARIVSTFPRVRFIANPSNFGFAGGMNAGIAAAAGEYVYLTEDDVSLRPGCLAAMVECLEQHADAALVAPVMYNQSSGDVRSAGGRFALDAVFSLEIITGRASGTYAPTYEAYKAYFKRVNDAGGINGHPVEITYEDDRGEPQRAAAAAKKLAENSILIVVSSVSATYKPFMTEAEARKVPLLFGGGVCPGESFPPANKLVFCSTSFGTKWDSRFALDFIKKESAGKRVKLGLVGQDIPLSRIEMEFAEARAKEMGFDVIPLVIAPITATDFTPFAQKLKEAGVDVVLVHPGRPGTKYRNSTEYLIDRLLRK